MNRTQLEHVIRAAGAIAEVDELIVIGSQAILGQHPDAPCALLTSREVDLYPANEPEKAILIDGSIGEGSLFDEQFKYYAHGVGPEAAKLPERWRGRLVPIKNENTRGVKAMCLAPVDIAVSKLLAGREKDFAYVAAMLRNDLLTAEQIDLVASELSKDLRQLLIERFVICSQQAH